MRDIRFRAWDASEKEMITWERLLNDPDDWLIELLTEETEDVLMQFTGLADRQGKEIYEGDILQPSHYKNWSRFKCIVTFKNGMFCFEQNGELIQEDNPLCDSLKNASSAGNNYEIIGNIYEDNDHD